jgi:hypothetical protein
MRLYQGTNFHLNYPEAAIWREDYNILDFVNEYGAYLIAVTATVTVNYGGTPHVINYAAQSSVGEVVINLSPLIKTYCPADYFITWKADFEDGNGTQYHDNNAIKDIAAYYGKTLQERHHGSCRVITYADLADIQKVDIFIPSGWVGSIKYNGLVTIHNQTTAAIEQAVNTLGGVQVDMIPGIFSSVWTGEVWEDELVSTWSVRLVQVCPARNGIKLVYYDTDGCKRYAIGEVLKKTMVAKRDEYRRGELSEYDTVPRSLLTGYSGTISVGFADVDPQQYLEDIMLSPVVTTERGSGTINVIPTTLTLVRDGKTKDIIIDFKIDA